MGEAVFSNRRNCANHIRLETNECSGDPAEVPADNNTIVLMEKSKMNGERQFGEQAPWGEKLRDARVRMLAATETNLRRSMAMPYHGDCFAATMGQLLPARVGGSPFDILTSIDYCAYFVAKRRCEDMVPALLKTLNLLERAEDTFDEHHLVYNLNDFRWNSPNDHGLLG